MSLTSVSALPSNLRARDADRAALLVEWLRVREVEVSVLRELRMERDLHVAVHGARQAGLAGEVRRRAAGYRLRVELAVADDSQLAGALGHEHRAVRVEKRESPGELQSRRHDHDANALALGRCRTPSACPGAGRLARPLGATGIPPWNGTVCWPEPTPRPRVAARPERVATSRQMQRESSRARPPDWRDQV